MKAIIFIAVVCCLAGIPKLSQAQVSGDTIRVLVIDSRDGNTYTGTLIREDETVYEIQTENLGRLQIRKLDVKKIAWIRKSQIVEGKLWFDNPQSSRYFWAPNGYGLKKGEGYYQNIWVLWNQVSYGLTDHFSIGAGVIPLFLFGGESAGYSPVWVVPKLSIPVIPEKLNIGVGALTGFLPAEERSGFGILYGNATLGNRNHNVTLGMGYGYAGGDWSGSPIINLGYMVRASSKTYFLSENYLISTGDGHLVLLAFGGRSFARNVGIDYGLFLPFTTGMDSFIALPWLGFTVPIGKPE